MKKIYFYPLVVTTVIIVILIVLFIFSLFVPYQLIVRFISVLVTVAIVFGLGFGIAHHISLQSSAFLAKKVKIESNVKEELQKGLIVKERQERLSQFEIDSVNNLFKATVAKEVKKHVQLITYDFLLMRLFGLYILGISLFVGLTVLLFHYPTIRAILLFIFQGRCP